MPWAETLKGVVQATVPRVVRRWVGRCVLASWREGERGQIIWAIGFLGGRDGWGKSAFCGGAFREPAGRLGLGFVGGVFRWLRVRESPGTRTENSRLFGPFLAILGSLDPILMGGVVSYQGVFKAGEICRGFMMSVTFGWFVAFSTKKHFYVGRGFLRGGKGGA